jgi:hypothetical protein
MKICTVEGCERDVYSLGMCSMHYQRSRRTGEIGIAETKKDFIKLELKFNIKKCNAAGCDEKALRMGLCLKHLKEWNFE